MNRSYNSGELFQALGSLLLVLLVLGLPTCLQNNMNSYIGNTFIKVETSDYETPYDIIAVNGDNTVTAYYNNQEVTVPYKKINNESFSFILPFDNQEYSVVIDDISIKDSNQYEKPKMSYQSPQNLIQPALGDDLLRKLPSIAFVKNSSGFIQVMIDNTDQFEFNQELYGRMIADQGSVKSD